MSNRISIKYLARGVKKRLALDKTLSRPGYQWCRDRVIAHLERATRSVELRLTIGEQEKGEFVSKLTIELAQRIAPDCRKVGERER